MRTIKEWRNKKIIVTDIFEYDGVIFHPGATGIVIDCAQHQILVKWDPGDIEYLDVIGNAWWIEPMHIAIYRKLIPNWRLRLGE